METPNDNVQAVQLMALELVRYAAQVGVIVTIERRPTVPLAMGHAEPVIAVRLARALATDADREQIATARADLAEARWIAEQQQIDGLAIADNAMFSVLMDECVRIDSDGTTLGLVDAHGSETDKLSTASADIVQAFTWLSARGFVGLATDADGEYLDVHRRPGEDES